MEQGEELETSSSAPLKKKKKKRCEKVYFVRRCVIRVITLTSLLPEREREKENSEKSTVRGAGAPKGLRRGDERERGGERERGVGRSSHCYRLMLAFFAS